MKRSKGDQGTLLKRPSRIMIRYLSDGEYEFIVQLLRINSDAEVY